jgi:hypothetical protein
MGGQTGVLVVGYTDSLFHELRGLGSRAVMRRDEVLVFGVDVVERAVYSSWWETFTPSASTRRDKEEVFMSFLY